MRLGGVVETSTIDWYGNVSLVVFFAGCNFRCPYCQNSGLIPMDSGEKLGPEYLRKRLEKEINQSQAEAARLEARLKDKTFLTRAPASVVDKERQKFAALTDKLERLKQQIINY